MSLQPPINIPAILRKFGLRPKKGLGQNFLMDDFTLQKVAGTAEICEDDMVLEIGPGLGSLTRHLAAAAHQVIAVELDRNLIPPLKDVLAPFGNTTIVQGDILKLDLSKLIATENYLVVANIPYYITSAVIRHLLESPNKPKRIILTIQREVAIRICANPPQMSILALSVQVYGKPKIAAKIPAGAFYPAPKVDSAVIRVDLYPEPIVPTDQINLFFRLIKAGFSQKRKNLRNSLSAGLAIPKDEVVSILENVDIDPKRRAETLSLDEWKILTDQVVKGSSFP